MNITLAADAKLIEKGRAYAARQGTSLNHLIRNYLQQVAGLSDLEQDAAEFARLAREHAGASPAGFVFDRNQAHRR